MRFMRAISTSSPRSRIAEGVVPASSLSIATRQPQRLNLDRAVEVAKDPGVAADFRDYLLMADPRGLPAYYVTSSGPLRRFAVTDRRNSDDHPTLEFHAPQQLFQPTSQINTALLLAEKDALLPPGTEAADMPRVYAAMIEPLLEMDRADLAEQARARIEAAAPKSPQGKTAAARIGLHSGALLQTRRALAGIKETDGAAFADAVELGGLLEVREGNAAAAARHFMNASKADAARPAPHRKLAELAAVNGNWPEAASRMKEYIATNPKNPALHWAALGEYYFADSKVEEAFPALIKALEIDPYSYWGHFRMARLYESQNKQPEAIEQYEFLARYAFDRDPDVYLKLTGLYREAGRLSDARALLRTGLRHFPASVAMYRIFREIGGV
jgi:tetratricopeptide (TPR) repeat protein